MNYNLLSDKNGRSIYLSENFISDFVSRILNDCFKDFSRKDRLFFFLSDFLTKKDRRGIDVSFDENYNIKLTIYLVNKKKNNKISTREIKDKIKDSIENLLDTYLDEINIIIL